jgi:hypothetical protein
MNRTHDRNERPTRVETHPQEPRRPVSTSANLAIKKRRLWVWAYAPWIP